MRLFRFIRILFVWLCVGAFAVGVSAETVSQKQASNIASTFFNAAYGQYMSAPKMVWNGRQLTTDRLFAPFYIYNHPAGGFVIVSADTKAFPILGYSRTSKFDRSKLSQSEEELLSRYAHEIELIRYDSRLPVRAEEAWINLPGYIQKVLDNPYDTEEFESLSEESRDIIEEIDRRNNSVMMPSAIEFMLYKPEYFRDYTLDDVTMDEEIPFELFDSFISEIEAEEKARQAALEEILSPSDPVVSKLGGAHYSIRFPDNVVLARIFSVQGARRMEKYFKNTNLVNLDLSSLVPGYYILFVVDENGKVYGIKLPR